MLTKDTDFSLLMKDGLTLELNLFKVILMPVVDLADHYQSLLITGTLRHALCTAWFWH